MLIKIKESLYSENGKSNAGLILNIVIAVIVLLLAVEICFAVNYSGVYVVDDSMLPTLTGARSADVIGGDYVYVNKHAEPDYGDIVVEYVASAKKYYIKRVIALGGDRVKLVKGQLFIKYKGSLEFTPVDEPYAMYGDVNLQKNNFPDDDNGYLVSEGTFFLMGDNRDYSKDSREDGSYPLKDLDGVVTKWSLKHKSFITAMHNYFKFQLPSYFGIKR